MRYPEDFVDKIIEGDWSKNKTVKLFD